jgi:hypothetical protein
LDDNDRANPYAPPAADSTSRPARANVDDATAAAIRRATLGREAVARLIGTLLIIAAAVAVATAAAMIAKDRAMLVERGVPDEVVRDFWAQAVGVVALFLVPVSAVAAVGVGVRLLRGWAYRGGLALWGMVILVGFAAATSSLKSHIGDAGFWLFVIAVAITFLIGQRIWSRVPFVFSPEYRAIVARTRQVRATWLVAAEVALVVLGLAGAGLVAAAVLR